MTEEVVQQSIEEKVLGKKDKGSAPVPKSAQNRFTAEHLWKITRQGCGSCVMAGSMVRDMLSLENKKKALSGQKSIKEGNAVFEFLK